MTDDDARAIVEAMADHSTEMLPEVLAVWFVVVSVCFAINVLAIGTRKALGYLRALVRSS